MDGSVLREWRRSRGWDAPDMARRLADAGWVSPQIQYNLFFPRALSLLRSIESGLSWLPLGAQYAVLARKR